MSMILFSRAIGPIPVSVIMREIHTSTIGVTEIPIETGAKVTDHSYVEPKRLTLEFADAYAAATWNALMRFQETRIPFTIVSGLAVYKNMIIRELGADRDEQFSTVLRGVAALQEVIIVSTARTSESKGSSNAKGGSDADTNKRTEGTVTRGDQASSTVEPGKNQSLLSRAITGSSSPAPMRESTGPGGMGGV